MTQGTECVASSSSGVSRNLLLTSKRFSAYFRRCKDGWLQSETGVFLKKGEIVNGRCARDAFPALFSFMSGITLKL